MKQLSPTPSPRTGRVTLYIETQDQERPDIVRDFEYRFIRITEARRFLRDQACVNIIGWSAFRNGRYLDGFGTLAQEVDNGPRS